MYEGIHISVQEIMILQFGLYIYMIYDLKIGCKEILNVRFNIFLRDEKADRKDPT